MSAITCMSTANLHTLSPNERRALELIVEEGGSILESRVPARSELDFLGAVSPGRLVYKKLERAGMIYFTEEDPLNAPGDPLHGFTFTREIYLTEIGLLALHAKA